MKKHLLILLAALLALCLILPACGSGSGGSGGQTADDEVISEEDEEDEDELDGDTAEEEPQAVIIYKTLEEALPVLEKDGYKKTADGYVAEDSDADVSSRRVVTAEGNNVHADLSYTYTSDNAEMEKFYKTNEEAVSIMVSSFITRLASVTEVEDGTLTYVIKVDGKVAKEGQMSLAEAYEYRDMADE